MMSRPISFVLLAGLSVLTACSAGGIFDAETVVSGPIQIVDPANHDVYTSGVSQANPFVVPFNDGGFSIGITEKHYGGPYTVTQTAFGGLPDDAFNYSCFEPHTVDSSDQVNVVRFQIDGAPAAATAAPSGQMATQPPSPCMFGETETYLIDDTKGHSVYFYLELGGAAVGAPDTKAAAKPA